MVYLLLLQREVSYLDNESINWIVAPDSEKNSINIESVELSLDKHVCPEVKLLDHGVRTFVKSPICRHTNTTNRQKLA